MTQRESQVFFDPTGKKNAKGRSSKKAGLAVCRGFSSRSTRTKSAGRGRAVRLPQR